MTQLVQQEPSRETRTSATQPKKSRLVAMVLVLLVVLLLGGAFSISRRFSERKALVVERDKLALQTVAVMKPSSEPSSDELVLPAQLQAYVESPIYARTNGYLLRWYKDIGSKVKKGDLLADIDTPEVDQELRQSRATREQVVAALNLAKINSERYQSLRKTDSVSQEEADTQTSAYQQ